MMYILRRSLPARAARPGNVRSLRASLRLESLESRSLLSAVSVVDDWLAQPLSVTPLAGVTNPTPRGYTASQISRAYGFDQIWFDGNNKGDGAGQTIAIVAAYDHPNIASDLATFSAAMGLAGAASFRKIDQNGGQNFPAPNAKWAQEIALDVQWAHAVAPAANIVLVEAYSATIPDLIAAVNTARNLPDVSVVSMSWGSGEIAGLSAYDQYFTTPGGHRGVTFIASAGDSGAQAVWPAISPNVIAVGGTTLAATNGYGGESAWTNSGGGFSRYVAQPTYQSTVFSSTMRSSPDVSYVANPSTGVAIYDSYAVGGRSGWFQIGGTSAGAPQWAGLVAIVNEGRALSGQPTLGDGHEAIYRLPASSFRDVTSGSNGFRAVGGYDLVTGRGSPVADAIVRELVGTTTTKPTPKPTASPAAPATSNPASTPSAAPREFQLVYRDRRWYIVQMAVDNGPPVVQDAGQSASALASAVMIAAMSPTSVSLPAAPPSTVDHARATSPQGTVAPVATVMTVPQRYRTANAPPAGGHQADARERSLQARATEVAEIEASTRQRVPLSQEFGGAVSDAATPWLRSGSLEATDFALCEPDFAIELGGVASAIGNSFAGTDLESSALALCVALTASFGSRVPSAGCAATTIAGLEIAPPQTRATRRKQRVTFASSR